MSDYPECEKMRAVSDESQKIGEFLDWLGTADMTIAVWTRLAPCEWRSWNGHRGCVDGRIIDFEDDDLDLDQCENCAGEGVVECNPFLERLNIGPEALLARYFEIDMVKVDAERAAMLDELRAQAD